MTIEALTTRDRLLDAAISLFATRGYAATSVADIQQACGLSPGSGALYKHFASKQELLRAAAQRQVSRMAESRRRVSAAPDADAADVLDAVADAILEGTETNADLFRVMFREPEATEEFADKLWSGVIANVYQKFGVGLRKTNDSGTTTIADPDATAAVIVAAIAYLPVVQLLIGHTPGDIEPERFREAWVRLAAALFSGTPAS